MKISRTHPVHYRSRPWFPFIILGMGVLLTLLSAYYVDRAADTKDRLLFDRSVLQTKEAIDKRLDTYTALLRGSASLFTTQEVVTRREFEEYVSLLQLREKYRGVQGIGYTIRISAEQKVATEAQLRAEGYTDFAIYPDFERPEYYAIVYLEPLDRRNQAAIGYDMYTERIRREAMNQARDTAAPAATGKVRLIQEIDADVQTGFLMYMPVYRTPDQPKTVAERREALQGFVYSPFRADDFFSGIFGNNNQYDVNLLVYDGDTIAPEALLYSRSGRETQEEFPVTNYSARSTMTIAGREWTIFIQPNQRFIASFERSLIPFILSGGFLISFILYLLSRWQYVARVRAERLADDLIHSQEALRHSESRMRQLMEANIIGVAFTDAKRNIVEANDAFLHLLGYSREDLQHGINTATITPEEFSLLDKKARKELEKKGVHKPYEKEYIRKDGTRIPVLIGRAVIKGSKKQVVGFVVDLTDRKRLERQKDEFISIASHELKTPVTSLKAYAQVLNKRFLTRGDKESAAHLQKMDAQLSKLTNLIKDLLDVTKIEAGKLQFQDERFDMNVLVKEIVEEMQRTTDRHTIQIKGSIKRKLHGDRERIGQVIINFLSNAIKYSPQADTIIVFLQNDAKYATIKVQDFGVGIPKDGVGKVFDRFFRVTGEREVTFPGLGLGLYISAEIIKRQGGKIWVESEVEKGSTFCFTLPVK